MKKDLGSNHMGEERPARMAKNRTPQGGMA